MTTTKSTTRRARKTEVAPALRIPLAVLASIPERLRTLHGAIKACVKVIDSDYETFRGKHNPVRNAFDDANNTANQAVNAFTTLESQAKSRSEKAAIKAAQEAKALTTAIYKAAGNIHNNDQFKSAFSDVPTTEATLEALLHCAAQIRVAIKPFGL